jgi:hypothetical protein
MCFTKQAILMRRSTVLSLPLQFVFPGLAVEFIQNEIKTKPTQDQREAPQHSA